MPPKTLLEMAGILSVPSRLSDAVIVVIDAQREYINGALPLPQVRPALDEIEQLLGRARSAGTPIIHIVHHGKPGSAFAPGTVGAAIAPQAAPAPGEPVVGKRLPNAFASTDLGDRVAALKRPAIVVVGFMTHMCVEATARASIDLGLKATIVASATATRDLPDPISGAILPAAEVQRNALAAMADRFATIVPDVAAIPD
jgi:nicotinamidase-related amidase